MVLRRIWFSFDQIAMPSIDSWVWSSMMSMKVLYTRMLFFECYAPPGKCSLMPEIRRISGIFILHSKIITLFFLKGNQPWTVWNALESFWMHIEICLWIKKIINPFCVFFSFYKIFVNFKQFQHQPLVVHQVECFAKVEEDGVNRLLFVQCTLTIVDDFDACIHGVPAR